MATITSLGYSIFTKYNGKGVRSAKRDLDSLSGRMQAVGDSMKSAGRTMTAAVTLPIIAAGAASVKMAMDFDREMSKVSSLVGVSQGQVKAWEKDVISMASNFGKSGTEAAEALFFITSAGLEGTDAMDALEASLKASAVGLGETKVVADLVTSAMNAYASEGMSAVAATDVLAAAVREGKLESGELAGAMGRVLPISSAMGVGFDEVGAAMAAMSRTGTDAAGASDQLRSMLVQILRPSADAEKALGEMGLSGAALQEHLEKKGLLSTLQLLSDRFDGNKAAMARVFPDTVAMAGFMDMMGDGADTTAEIFGELEDSTGSLGEAFDKTAKSDAFRMEQALATLKNAGLLIGRELLPVIADLVENITPLVDKFSDLDPGTKKAIIGFAGVAAAAGPVLWVAGQMVTTLGTLKGAFGKIPGGAALAKGGLIGLGAAALIALADTEEFREGVDIIFEEVSEWWNGEDVMVDAWASRHGEMEERAEGFKDKLAELWSGISDLLFGEQVEMRDSWDHTFDEMDETSKKKTDGIFLNLDNFFVDVNNLFGGNATHATTWQEALSKEMDTVLGNFEGIVEELNAVMDGDFAELWVEKEGPASRWIREQLIEPWQDYDVSESAIGAVFTSIGSFIETKSSEWKISWSSLWEGWGDFDIEDTPIFVVLSAIGSWFGGWIDQVKTQWGEAWDQIWETEFSWEEIPIVQAFKSLYDWLVGNSIVPDMVNEVLRWFGIMFSSLPGWSAFWEGLGVLWTGFKETVLQNVADWFETHLPTASKAFRQAASGDFSGAWQTIGEGWSEAKETVFQNIANWFETHLPTASDAFRRAARGDFSGAWEAIGEGWSEAKESTFQNIADWFETHLPTASEAFRRLARGDFSGAWSAISEGWNQAKETTFQNIADWFETHLPTASEAFRRLARGDFSGAWEAISEGWDQAKENTFQNIADWFETHLPSTSNTMRRLVNGDWGGMFESLEGTWQEIRTKVLKPYAQWLEEHMPKSTQNGVRAVGRAFDLLRNAIAAPVKWVIDGPIGRGLVEMWNKVAPSIGMDKIDTPKFSYKLARGGILPGTSSWRQGDDQWVKMRRGEGVYVSEALRDPYERARLYAVNRAAMRGENLSRFRDGFATGGQIGMPGHDFNPEEFRFSLGGILGDVGKKLNDSWESIQGNIVGWASPLNKLVDEAKNKFGKSKKEFKSLGYHVPKTLIDAAMSIFSDKDAEYNAQFAGDGGWGPFGSFTFNGRPADLPGLRGTNPHVRLIGNFIASMFGVTQAWGLGGPPEHSTGNAIDYMVGTGSGQKRGDGIAAYYLKHAKDLALKWIIWRQKIFNTAKGSWRQMEDRGNPTQNHFDHPHVLHHGSAPSGLVDFIRRQKGVKFSDSGAGGGGGGAGSGNTIMTSFWDSFQPMANGRRMHGSAIASSVIPLGTRLRVKVGNKSATGTVDDLGPSSFVYRRHHPKALLDLAEPMMERLTGRRSNVVHGSFSVLSRGSGRTLFGYTRWDGRYEPGRGTNGFARGGIGGYEQGTDAVPHDGLYYLHRNEKVVPAENSGYTGGGGEIHLHFHGPVASKQAATDMVVDGMRDAERKGILPKGTVRR